MRSGLMRTWMPLIAIVGLGTALDQVSKHWAVAHLQTRGIVTIVGGFLELRYVRNPGAFFGLGGSLPNDARRWLLSGVAGCIVLILVRVYARSAAPPRARRLRAGLALLLAGALGNLIDRVRHGEVVDFLHLRLGDVFHWATFNVADICIALGLGLLVLEWPRASARPAPMATAAREPG